MVVHEKKTKYDTLCQEIEMCGWKCKALPVRDGLQRGYASRTLIAYLRGFDLSAMEIKETTKEPEAGSVILE